MWVLIHKITYSYNQIIFRYPVEAIIWTIGLILLALYNPSHQEHMSLCIFNGLGLKFCPGCGLGRAISHVFHGEILMSFQSHPVGIPAVLILFYRTIKLYIEYFKRLKLNYNHYGKRT